MPHFCCVVKFSRRLERDAVSFIRISALLRNGSNYLKALYVERRNSWVNSLKRGPLSESQLKNSRIWSRHFITGKPAGLEDKSNPDWIPNQNMGFVSSKQPDTSASLSFERSVRIKLAIETEVQPEVLQENGKTEEDPADLQGVHEPYHKPISLREIIEALVSESVQTDVTMEHLDQVCNDLTFSNSKIYSLRTKLDSMDLAEDSLDSFYWSA